MTTPHLRRLRLIIRGQVQGVGFRFYTERKALDLGLTGWVRNLSDGSVEVLTEGNKSNLQRLLTWARQGPPSARVLHVESEWLVATGEFEGFGIA